MIRLFGSTVLDYCLALKNRMATRHGNKTYMQILLDPHRAALVQQLAQHKGVRATAWVRDAVYRLLEKELPASTYNEAVAKDEATWRESVRKRVEGRLNAKQNAAGVEQPVDDTDLV